MVENTIVREALDDSNYDIWSNCMETYLVSEDLWDIIEPEGEGEGEGDESSKNHSSRTWRRKNASALHALHVSCGTAPLSRIGKLKSAKEAWNLLRSMNQHNDEITTLQNKQSDDSSHSPQNNQNIVPKEPSFDNDGIDYGPFVEATKSRNWKRMKEFLNSHPGANATVVVDGRTALHCALEIGKIKIARLLVEKTKRPQDLGLQDDKGYTALHHLMSCDEPGVLKLVQRMVSVNNNLPNICIRGESCNYPVVMAALFGFKDTTHYLYDLTHEEKLDPVKGYAGVQLLINCINNKLFDIASKIVDKSPVILLQPNSALSPFYLLAKSFSHENSKLLSPVGGGADKNQLAFLQLVCKKVELLFDPPMVQQFLYPVMVEASKEGLFEFVSEMVKAKSCLAVAHVDGKGIFCHAAECRQEKVFSLIYNFPELRDGLMWFSNPEYNSIVHLVANLAPPFMSLDWKSGPILKMQRELQWFQEVYRMTKPVLRDCANKAGLTPRQLFTETHKELVDAGEKSMKEIAQCSTVVGGLIITMMFAAAFTVPGGSNDDGLPLFMSKALFKIFMVCDALSLYSAIASVLTFLGILTSRYSETDFLLMLPMKLMIGLYTLFFSVLTMMLAFCAVLALTLDGSLRYILPILLLLLIPVILYFSFILPLFFEIFMSTFRPNIFDKRKIDIPWKNIPPLEDIDEEDTKILMNNPSNAEKV